MSKLVRNRPIKVLSAKDDVPRKVVYQGKLLVSERILDRWRDTGMWWEGESTKEFWRILFQDSRVWEIYQDRVSGEWFLYKIYD